MSRTPLEMKVPQESVIFHTISLLGQNDPLRSASALRSAAEMKLSSLLSPILFLHNECSVPNQCIILLYLKKCSYPSISITLRIFGVIQANIQILDPELLFIPPLNIQLEIQSIISKRQLMIDSGMRELRFAVQHT